MSNTKKGSPPSIFVDFPPHIAYQSDQNRIVRGDQHDSAMYAGKFINRIADYAKVDTQYNNDSIERRYTDEKYS